MNNIFDTHAHYDDAKFDTDRDNLLASFKEAGIAGIINCGTNVKTSKISLDISEKHDYIYAACGIHPEEANDVKESDFEIIEQMLNEEKCVAVGEIGLDYYWDGVPKDVQKEVFARQLEMAVKHDMPVIIHDREAHGDTLELLKKYKPKGVLHCYSGSVETAREILNLGMYLGFGGAVTFKNAVKPIEVVSMVPTDRILLETDCPYMAPVPMRGKRNQSTYIEYVAEKIAEIKNCNAQEIIDIARKNTTDLFGI